MQSDVSDIRRRPTGKAFDLAVFIGRFQPFHNGHLSVIRQALAQAECVLVLVGSANRARDTRNPFTYLERRDMIRDSILEHVATTLSRIYIKPLGDSPYAPDDWINAVHTAARSATSVLRPRVCLIGHERDATSQYLKLFPEWAYVPAKDTNTNATALRTSLFSTTLDFERRGWTDSDVVWPEVATEATIEFLKSWVGGEEWVRLIKERTAEEAYRARWGKGPFLTADAVIVQSGYVLLIERGGDEGAGQLALPGGFLEPGETLLDGAIREGLEETNIFNTLEGVHGEDPAVDRRRAEMLRASLKGAMTFDDPHRSRRAHIVTQGHLFRLPDSHSLPRVRGLDDASQAFWMPISEVRPERLYDDHSFVLDKLLSLY